MIQAHPTHTWRSFLEKDRPGTCYSCGIFVQSIEALLLCSALNPVAEAERVEAEMGAANEPVEIDWFSLNKQGSST